MSQHHPPRTMTDPHTLARIADALERLAPPPPASADPLAFPAYVWRGQALAAARHSRRCRSISSPASMRKAALTAMSTASRGPCGARRAALGRARHGQVGAGEERGRRGAGGRARHRAGGACRRCAAQPAGAVRAARQGRTRLRALHRRSGVRRARRRPAHPALAAGGGAEARPANTRLFVTANRRHILPRDLSEQDSAINPRDVVDDKLALADRFGLSWASTSSIRIIMSR